MKKLVLVFTLTFLMTGFSPLIGQKLNGESFSFKKGKNEWSDTIYKKLLTKKMAKDGQKAVLLGIRYKFEQNVDEGTWYQIEITNKSNDQKVKFNIASKNKMDLYSVKLNPLQTKIFKKLYYKKKTVGIDDSQNSDADFYISPYEELLDNRN